MKTAKKIVYQRDHPELKEEIKNPKNFKQNYCVSINNTYLVYDECI
jgi:hypothetical protein